MKATILSATLVSLLSLTACDVGGGGDGSPTPSGSGTVTLQPEQGVDFGTGAVQAPGNFANSDLYATSNGTALKLSAGGEAITRSRPCNFFLTSGGIHQTFTRLSDVPNTKPDDTMTTPLPKAKPGNAFVCLTASGGYTKGWLSAADASAVTIEFEPLP